MPTYDCPLGDEHCELLNRTIQTAARNIPFAQDCIDCGWPAHDIKADLERQLAQATEAKRRFFPNKP